MEKKQVSIKKIIIALLGVWLIGIGIGFNNQAGLGNDAVALFYDGVCKALGFGVKDLGMVSNGVNTVLALILLIVGRKYLHIGTLIYLLPYGMFVNFGTWLYSVVIIEPGFWVRVLCSVFGCVILYFGVAVVITMDIGVDPLLGTILVIKEFTGKDFRTVKILYDIGLCIIGAILGGTIGVITIITAFTAGIGIQFFTDLLQKLKK